MKYFCVTETISLYIQKYVQYRKRKVFYGSTGKIDDLVPLMAKHKNEKYLVPLSDVHDDSVKKMLDSKGLQHSECVMYRTVCNDLTEEEIKNFDYDMCVFFSPSGVAAYKKAFPEVTGAPMKAATFGPATSKAAHDAGLDVQVEAPSPKYPSMTSALRRYLIDQEED